jgi:hypothetical protein
MLLWSASEPTGSLDELYGPHIGTESPDDITRLISRLDSLLRGIRLEERLLNLKNPTHQTIANLLAQSGSRSSACHLRFAHGLSRSDKRARSQPFQIF